MKKVFGELIVLKVKKNRDGKEGVSLEKGEVGAKPYWTWSTKGTFFANLPNSIRHSGDFS